ncbi:hypothetical protein HOV03_gp43 [Gordonia phage Asapag]|uniref:Uncharacterized protein n=1 Tax=Gordonia phage Asapag TaxID=2507862 RepID=A0A410TDU5_9CAUD|nr:hypothetical protein HOV03_gp43 [Gordonia phage Asapag]QAU07192.1 hypothetical protein SEA_ASAPAG_43 [Gordonia phage Asapag]
MSVSYHPRKVVLLATGARYRRSWPVAHTDKTKPFDVKLRDGDLHWREDHDHRDGACDLPPLDSPDAFVWRRRCRRQFVYTGTSVCTCAQCSGLWHETKPQRRRRSRAGAKRRTADWDREY